jgi:hypothetical protein
MCMSAIWQVFKSGKEHGPFTANQLRRLVESGQLLPNDKVKREGDISWVSADRVKGLFKNTAESVLPPVVSPPPPPITPPPRIVQATPDRYPTVDRTFSRQRLGILAVAAAGGLGTFLPWAHAPIVGSIHGTAGDGWFTLAMFAVPIILAGTGDRALDLLGARRASCVVLSLLASGIGIWKIIAFNSHMADIPRDNPFAKALSAGTRVGAGLYVITAAGIALTYVAFVMTRSVSNREVRQMR